MTALTFKMHDKIIPLYSGVYGRSDTSEVSELLDITRVYNVTEYKTFGGEQFIKLWECGNEFWFKSEYFSRFKKREVSVIWGMEGVLIYRDSQDELLIEPTYDDKIPVFTSETEAFDFVAHYSLKHEEFAYKYCKELSEEAQIQVRNQVIRGKYGTYPQ